jgi:hypothetical protein
MLLRNKIRAYLIAVVAQALAIGCVQKETSKGSAEAGAAPVRTAPAPEPKGPVAVTPELAASIQRVCNDICDRSRQLKCQHASECMPNCLAMRTATPCTQQVTALYDCLVKQPVQNWECAEDGVAAIREAFCNKEQEATIACMEAKVTP